MDSYYAMRSIWSWQKKEVKSSFRDLGRVVQILTKFIQD